MKLPVLPWYSEGLRFTCTASGDCCTGGHGFVWLTVEEIGRMAEHLGMSRRAFLRRYCRTVEGKVSLKEVCNEKGQYDCIFLTDIPDDGSGNGCGGRRGCSVYAVRPTQCRTWPFWPENLTSRRAWDRAAKGCRGMNRGERYSRRRIEALRDAEDWPERCPTSGEAELGLRKPGEK